MFLRGRHRFSMHLRLCHSLVPRNFDGQSHMVASRSLGGVLYLIMIAGSLYFLLSYMPLNQVRLWQYFGFSPFSEKLNSVSHCI